MKSSPHFVISGSISAVRRPRICFGGEHLISFISFKFVFCVFYVYLDEVDGEYVELNGEICLDAM